MRDRGVDTLDELDPQAVGQWAQYLNRRVQAHDADSSSGITQASEWTYYNLVSTYLTYCREWEYIGENPAKVAVVENAMPDRPSGGAKDQQFWTPAQCQRLISYVDGQAADAIDDRGSEAVAEVRDRASVTLVGYSAVRGAEILRVPRGDDNRPGRQGATWDDLDLEDETIDVLGKNQEHEQAPLTDKPVAALERWRDVLDPAADDWPLFSTAHRPTLWSALRDQFGEHGHDDVDGLLDPYDDPMDAYRRTTACRQH